MRQVFVTGEQDAETLKRQVIRSPELKITRGWLQSELNRIFRSFLFLKS